MKSLLARFVKDESGATAIEYGLIATLVSLAIAGTAGSAGSALSAKFTEIANKLNGTPATP